jgi:dTDP-glucose pyrophosphorylase
MNSDESWRQAIILNTSTVLQGIKTLNESQAKIALVVNESGKLEGTVSDGDVRRGLMRGIGLAASIEEIFNPDPKVVPPHLTREVVVQLMKTNRIFQIPIVDEDSQLLGLHLWDEVSTTVQRPNTMIIMAGGRGTRLNPQTNTCPKPLLPVGGKPILEHIIERASSQGFSKFVIAINYLGDMIENYFGDGKSFNVQIEYLREEKPLGTAGSLSLLNPLPKIPFVVTNGDVISDINYGNIIDFHIEHNAMATMAVRLQEWQNPYGVVQIREFQIHEYIEKPLVRNYINAGVYVLSPSSIQSLVEGEPCDMPDIFQKLLSESRLAVAYPIHEGWIDVGQPKDYFLANQQYERPSAEGVFDQND